MFVYSIVFTSNRDGVVFVKRQLQKLQLNDNPRAWYMYY